MVALALAGPTSPLRSKAEVRRTIGWMPVRIESGTGVGGQQTYLKQCPGLKLIANYGAQCSGIFAASERLFMVVDGALTEIDDDYTATSLGLTSFGRAEFAANDTQVCVVADNQAWAFDLSSNALTQILTNFLGSSVVDVLDGFGIFIRPGTAQFYITANQDFTSIDPLQFTSIESTPGDLVAGIVNRRQAFFMKNASAEVWYDAGGDFPLSRDDSAAIAAGCAAPKSLRRLNGVLYWIARNDEGTAVVLSMAGTAPQRASSQALEEALGGLDDLSSATAWTYQQEGLSFYVLNAPGLQTTWVYEASAGLWHERAEWVGDYAPWRAIGHALAFGKNFVADASGNLYQLDPLTNANGTDALLRDWISPHSAMPNFAKQAFSSFEIVGDTGSGNPFDKQLLLRYSNDGGKTWEDWISLPLGVIGDYQSRIRATQLGSAKDRVWQVRVTDDVRCDIIAALVNER